MSKTNKKRDARARVMPRPGAVPQDIRVRVSTGLDVMEDVRIAEVQLAQGLGMSHKTALKDVLARVGG